MFPLETIGTNSIKNIYNQLNYKSTCLLQNNFFGKPHNNRNFIPDFGNSDENFQLILPSADSARPFECCHPFQNENNFWEQEIVTWT